MAVSVADSNADEVRITATGDLNEPEAAALRSALVGAMRRTGARRVVVNLDGADTLDALVVGTLIAAVGIALDQNVPFVVECANPIVAERLTTAGLDVAGLHSGL